MSNTNGSPATDKQIDYLIALYNKVHAGAGVKFLSQCSELPMTQREKKGGMTKGEASAHIDSLKAAVR